MSHHLDTPLASQNGQLYLDDLYVFAGDRSTVFIMDVNSTITGPDVQRGFHPEAHYEFKVHFDGADFEALTYRVSFGEGDAAGRQALQLHALTGDERTVISDPHARYFGTELHGSELTPGDGARIGAIDFDGWFAARLQGAAR